MGNQRVHDSLQFFTASVDTLVQSLAADSKDKFSHTTQHYLDIEFVFAKRNYPYEYMNGRDKYLLTELPSIDGFYNSLSEETISPEKYDRAQKVWREFGIENMQQYHERYLNLGVLLIADVFEIFGKRASWTTNSTARIIILYPDSHSMRVSNLPKMNSTCLQIAKSSFLSRTLFAVEFAS